MGRQHGILTDTYERIVIDSGAVYKNYGETGQILLGATRGGNSFVIETEYRIMEVDGARGPVKGGRRITNVTAKLTANFVEISEDILRLGLAGSSRAHYPSTGTATHDEITRALTIAASDYLTNIAIVGEVTGSSAAIVCGIKNALGDGNIEISFADKDESVVAVTFTGHFLPSALDSEPWFIRYPDDIGPTTTTAGA
jgi:hypothetical protein